MKDGRTHLSYKAELIKEISGNRCITTYIPEKETKGRRTWNGDEVARKEFHLNRRPPAKESMVKL